VRELDRLYVNRRSRPHESTAPISPPRPPAPRSGPTFIGIAAFFYPRCVAAVTKPRCCYKIVTLARVPFAQMNTPHPTTLRKMLRTLAICCGLTTLAFTETLAPARAYEMPYDPYKWCAVGSDATNCGFLTLEQCRMSSRNCQPNQFYNPRPSPSQQHRR
jgi:hypothetical protein